MLVRTWRNWNPCALPVGMSCGTADMKNSIMVPQKTENRATISLSNPSTRYIRKGREISMAKRRLCAYAECSTNTVVKMWKQPKCHEPMSGYKTVVYRWTMEYYSAFTKEGDPAICNGMDEPWGHDAIWNKLDTKQKLHDFTDMLNLKMLSTEE